jgi:hypothetical protein
MADAGGRGFGFSATGRPDWWAQGSKPTRAVSASPSRPGLSKDAAGARRRWACVRRQRMHVEGRQQLMQGAAVCDCKPAGRECRESACQPPSFALCAPLPAGQTVLAHPSPATASSLQLLHPGWQRAPTPRAGRPDPAAPTQQASGPHPPPLLREEPRCPTLRCQGQPSAVHRPRPGQAAAGCAQVTRRWWRRPRRPVMSCCCRLSSRPLPARRCWPPSASRA